jgi:hypothetical protein
MSFNPKTFLFIHITILLLQLPFIHSEYKSINNIPSLKEGFSLFSFGLPSTAKPLYYIDINNDKKYHSL